MLPNTVAEEPAIYAARELFRLIAVEELAKGTCAAVYPLDVVAETLGIPRPKQHIDGVQIPALYEAGQYAAILAYCAIDAATCAMAYRLMAGLEEEGRP